MADPEEATRVALRSIAHRISSLDREIISLDQQLKALVVEAAPSTQKLACVGIIVPLNC